MVFPVVLCGGVGSRLWPLSRDTHPKPFITLADGESLLQKAFLRGAEQAHVSEIVTVTNRDLFFKIEDQYRQINQGNIGTSYILEPFGRNTAAAIASAALHLQKAHGDQAVMLVLAADHVISKPEKFMAAVEKAAGLLVVGSSLMAYSAFRLCRAVAPPKFSGRRVAPRSGRWRLQGVAEHGTFRCVGRPRRRADDPAFGGAGDCLRL